MKRTRGWTTLLLAATALSAVSCGDQGGGDQVPAESNDAPPDSTPVAMIASGTVERPVVPTPAAESTAAARPTSEGRRRTVPVATAMAAVPFPLFEPSDLPETTYRPGTVHLIEPHEGQQSDSLPAVRIIYDFERSGSLIVLQSPARGVPSDGEQVGEINGNPVFQKKIGEQTIVVWEQDGVNIEMRGQRLEPDQLLAYARRMVPMAQGASSPP